MILRTAYRFGGRYEWAQHIELAEGEGITRAELAALGAGSTPSDGPARTGRAGGGRRDGGRRRRVRRHLGRAGRAARPGRADRAPHADRPLHDVDDGLRSLRMPLEPRAEALASGCRAVRRRRGGPMPPLLEAGASRSSVPAPSRHATRTPRSATAGPSWCAPPGRAPRSSASTGTRPRSRRPGVDHRGGWEGSDRGRRRHHRGGLPPCGRRRAGTCARRARVNVGTGFGTGVAGTSPDDWDRTFAFNLRAHFLLVRRALVRFGRRLDRVLRLGRRPQPGSRIPAYDASKAGLLGLSRHVAVEGARPVSAPTSSPPVSSTRRWAEPPPLVDRRAPARLSPWIGRGRPRRLPPHRVPALERGRLRDRPGPWRRRRAHTRMSAHSGQPRSGHHVAPRAPPRPGPARGEVQPGVHEQDHRPRGRLGCPAWGS